jgi:hypothetical protein
VCAAVLFFNLCAAAQQSLGTLRGNVKDELGGVIIGAAVTVADAAGVEKTAATDEQGNYVFSALPPGRYTVRLTADGRTLTAPVTVRRNPWITDVTDADLRAQYAFGRRVRDEATAANRLVIAVRRAKAQLDDRYRRAAADSALRAVPLPPDRDAAPPK